MHANAHSICSNILGGTLTAQQMLLCRVKGCTGFTSRKIFNLEELFLYNSVFKSVSFITPSTVKFIKYLVFEKSRPPSVYYSTYFDLMV